MVSGTLYTFPESYRATKIRVAAAHAGSNLNVVEVKSDDKNHHHVPAFESDDKKVHLIETNAIAYYVANDKLRGSNDEERARILQWLNWGSNDVASAVASWVYPALSLVESTPQNVQRAKADLKNIFEFLNSFLQTRTYLVGERLTLADISLAADLLLAYEHVADEAFRKPFANVNRWFTTVTHQTHFKNVAGEIKLAVKAPEYDAKKHAEQKKQQEQKPKEAKKEEKKPAAAEPKKEAKKEEKKPAKKDDDEEEDDVLAEEPKQNDPFAAMPKGTLNMDEFKRVYSNEDTATKAIPYFWSHFDKENYSIWYCEYKYSNELTLTFMSSNLIGGMFQRIERLRKNAFASMAVFGENNDNLIAGVWFWRGHELVFPLCPDWTTDYESYEWKKLNPDDENDKKLVNQFFLWEGDVKGKKFNAGKIFK